MLKVLFAALSAAYPVLLVGAIWMYLPTIQTLPF